MTLAKMQDEIVRKEARLVKFFKFNLISPNHNQFHHFSSSINLIDFIYFLVGNNTSLGNFLKSLIFKTSLLMFVR